MKNLQQAPQGFVLSTVTVNAGIAGWDIEQRLAWIRETDTGADAILIQRDGDYSGLYQRVEHKAYTIKSKRARQ